MQYVPFGKTGLTTSRLGFGTMRMPTYKQGEKNVLDHEAAVKLIRQGIDGGITYVDTAYPYHQGESEIAVGKALKNGYRERVILTSKLPLWLVKEESDMNRLLDEQLKKLDVPYLDFYLMHATNKDRLKQMQSMHYKEFIRQAKKDGRIRHAGFSFHDDKQAFLDILHDFDEWELAQIQFNYLDSTNQATEDGLKEAGRIGVPIVVMEPLRGGALTNPPGEVKAKMDAFSVRRSAAEWAFAYIANYAEVATILSGMSNEEQVMDNLRIFDTLKTGMLSEEEIAFIASLKALYEARIPIPCTGCAYCQPCPLGVVIPDLFDAFNESNMLDKPERFLRPYKHFIDKESDASRCVKCRKCEKLCPQQLPITKWLETLQETYNKSLL